MRIALLELQLLLRVTNRLPFTKFTSFPIPRARHFFAPLSRLFSSSIPQEFLTYIHTLFHAMADSSPHPEPISFFPSFSFRNPSSDSGSVLPTPVCTSTSPPRKRFGGVSRDKVHVHRCTCLPATRSVRDSLLPMTQLRCGRSIKRYPYYRIDFFCGLDCEASPRALEISPGWCICKRIYITRFSLGCVCRSFLS